MVTASTLASSMVRDSTVALLCTCMVLSSEVIVLLFSWIFLIRRRSEEHTSELQSLMRTSYAVFCMKKKMPRHQGSNTVILDGTSLPTPSTYGTYMSSNIVRVTVNTTRVHTRTRYNHR